MLSVGVWFADSMVCCNWQCVKSDSSQYLDNVLVVVDNDTSSQAQRV